mmetsp:Transcript_2257/g.6463  ORF Transcript_2257/g.6463 Transcript_2257/m.6463 type:complete len:217 (-) Transcript_2257:2248-2898(-)
MTQSPECPKEQRTQQIGMCIPVDSSAPLRSMPSRSSSLSLVPKAKESVENAEPSQIGSVKWWSSSSSAYAEASLAGSPRNECSAGGCGFARRSHTSKDPISVPATIKWERSLTTAAEVIRQNEYRQRAGLSELPSVERPTRGCSPIIDSSGLTKDSRTPSGTFLFFHGQVYRTSAWSAPNQFGQMLTSPTHTSAPTHRSTKLACNPHTSELTESAC